MSISCIAVNKGTPSVPEEILAKGGPNGEIFVIVAPSPTTVSGLSAAFVRTQLCKATGGTLLSFGVNMSDATPVAGLYLQAFDSVGPPATADLKWVVAHLFATDAPQWNEVDLDISIFTTGILLALSSTESTYTDPGTDDGWFNFKVS